MKLTKAQVKNMARIDAWIAGEPFRENSRDKNPQVPDLQFEDVLEQFVPRYASESGAFYTPLEAAEEALGWVADIYYEGTPDDPTTILEPCAGIGNLLYPLLRNRDTGPGYKVDAYELDKAAFAVGQKLFPGVRWVNDDPFSHLADIEGKYDFVICNPPFDTVWGMTDGEAMCQGRAKKSMYIFLELCIRALKPGGQLIIIGPYNLVDKMPKPLRAWVDERAKLETKQGPLSGEFALTSLTVHAFYFRRNEVEQEEALVVEVPLTGRQTRLDPPRPVTPASINDPFYDPWFNQWVAICREYPGQVVILKQDDFYAAYSQDAAIVALQCGLTQTLRTYAPDYHLPMTVIPADRIVECIATLKRMCYQIAPNADLPQDVFVWQGPAEPETRATTPAMQLSFFDLIQG